MVDEPNVSAGRDRVADQTVTFGAPNGLTWIDTTATAMAFP
jgi:hypothetical protein